MAGYSGRKGPNVSQYLSNLNSIPSDQELSTQQSDGFDFTNDLAAFTNAEFFDFDQGEHAFDPAVDYSHPDGLDPANPVAVLNGMKPADLDFTFQPLDPFFNPDTSINVTQPALQTNFPHQPNLASPTSFNPSPAPGSKRPISPTSPASNLGQDEDSRIAAEEDKRRRNTAASARFRVKKKQREAALEQKAKELNDKTSTLEQRIGQLQTENEWLKSLITEKKGKEYLAEEWKAFKRRAGSVSDSEKEGDRSSEPRKKGVGTA
ncbi:MAG: hypothetical protein L6R42_003051 [Xanthoria sp. 1 TBL-2021]|nr:MAG: hypothetical protein L6R42_003051 [Xanthoria sp. 1 TBL-2021]